MVIRTECMRRRVLRQGRLRWQRKGGGRVLQCAVPSLNLEAGDRLEPSPQLCDVAQFSSARLPCAYEYVLLDNSCLKPQSRARHMARGRKQKPAEPAHPAWLKAQAAPVGVPPDFAAKVTEAAPPRNCSPMLMVTTAMQYMTQFAESVPMFRHSLARYNK